MSLPADLLTIIVPVYQIQEAYLRRCMESLLEEGRGDCRIILVDDGSQDHCGRICDQYAGKDSRIVVIHQKNGGVSAARNRAMEAVQTKWLSFVDADDWVCPEYVSVIMDALEGRARDADILMFDYLRVLKTENKEESLRWESGYLDPSLLDCIRRAAFYKFLDKGKENPYEAIVLWNKAYRRDFLREKGICFEEEARKGQDRIFNADAFLSASRIYYLPRTLYAYRCIEQSRTNRYDPAVPKLTRIELQCLRDALRKHGMEKKAGKYLQYRAATRLYACLRLYCFHENNPLSKQEKIRQAKRMAASEPFARAIRTVDPGLLNLQEKIFLLCVRKKLFGIVYLLVKARSRATGKRLG